MVDKPVLWRSPRLPTIALLSSLLVPQCRPQMSLFVTWLLEPGSLGGLAKLSGDIKALTAATEDRFSYLRAIFPQSMGHCDYPRSTFTNILYLHDFFVLVSFGLESRG
jgi:hypothetical protein